MFAFVETRCFASLIARNARHRDARLREIYKNYVVIILTSRDAMLRVSYCQKREASRREASRREASRLYKNRDARHRVSTKTETQGIVSKQKQRRKASCRNKNRDARHRVETKTETRG
ncbi:MAG TPA: hypothetical protein ENF37_02120, partial [Beggiatoa sp.]|nr:hypothetical protein [Beggiatoa sp.]